LESESVEGPEQPAAAAGDALSIVGSGPRLTRAAATAR